MAKERGGRTELTQEERTEASRNALIGATFKVIAEEGYRAASLVRISEVAGLSRGLANYHFGTKRNLIEAVIKQITDTFAPTLPALEEGLSGYECVEQLFDSYIQGLISKGRQYSTSRVMLLLAAEALTDAPEIDEAVKDAYDAVRDRIQDYLEHGMADGSVRSDISAVSDALMLHGLLRGIVLQYFVSGDDQELVQAGDATRELLTFLRP